MNITLKNTDPVNAIITISIVGEDYQVSVENSLKRMRQSMEIPGFRKGMVPMGLVKSRFGESVIAEEINKLVGEKLYSYIRDNNLNVLGEPLPNETEQKEIDFKKQTDFDFVFDIALAPELAIELSKNDTLPFYEVEITDEMVNKQIEMYQSNYGIYEKVDEFEDKDMLKGSLVELASNGKKKREGLVVEDAVIMPSYIKNEEEKAKFAGTKKNESVQFNPAAAYEGNEAELASLLKLEKEAVKEYAEDFRLEIKEITRYMQAQLDQTLFDKVFGPNEVTTVEDFTNRVKESIAKQYNESANYKFSLDTRKYIESKTEGVVLPNAFLKRWLQASDSKRTLESIEADFPKIQSDLLFHLAKEKLAKQYEIKVEVEDLTHYAKEATLAQFAQYGMMHLPDDILEQYAQEMLQKEESRRGILDRAVEDKLMQRIKSEITIDNKVLSMEDFGKLFEQNEEQ